MTDVIKEKASCINIKCVLNYEGYLDQYITIFLRYLMLLLLKEKKWKNKTKFINLCLLDK